MNLERSFIKKKKKNERKDSYMSLFVKIVIDM